MDATNDGLEVRQMANQQEQLDFLTSVAHELRTPLAAINFATKSLSLEELSTSGRETVQIIERQVQAIARQVDDLLDLSRITTGKVCLKLERVEASDMIKQAVETVQTLIQERRHRLHIEVPHGDAWFDADHFRVQQVLTNLLNNAAKYTDCGGDIHLTCIVGDEIVFSVRDNGAGINKENLAGIWDLYSQESRLSSKAKGGLGMGLPLVRQLMELHGGSIIAFSEGENRGAEFRASFPLTPTPTSERVKILKILKILVVEDNRDNARALSELLKLTGCEVGVAHTGTAAIRQSSVNAYDFIFIDIGLPDMTGFEVSRILRQQNNHAKLAAISGHNVSIDDGDFDEIFAKPVSIETLISYIGGPVVA